MTQISFRAEIDEYTNLKYTLKEFKRVHIIGKIAMIFRVNITENKILFITIRHRDDAYN